MSRTTLEASQIRSKNRRRLYFWYVMQSNALFVVWSLGTTFLSDTVLQTYRQHLQEHCTGIPAVKALSSKALLRLLLVQQGIWLLDVKPFCSFPMFQEELTLAYRQILLSPWLVGCPFWCSTVKHCHPAGRSCTVWTNHDMREALSCIYTAGAVTSPQVSAVSHNTSRAFTKQLRPRTCKLICLQVRGISLWLTS